MRKIELLAPAGDLERLKIAVMYGADAVFIGGKRFSLRSRASNFDLDDIAEAVKFADQYGAQVHVTINMLPHDEDLVGLKEYILALAKVGVTAVICASLYIAKKVIELETNMEVHLSTQQSTLNSLAVDFYESLGIDRVVLGRELSISEVTTITNKANIDIEAFIHGGMCSNFSGRCTLSNFMTFRDANRGGCAQSCRWSYKVYENDTLISDPEVMFSQSSKDLMAANYIEELIKADVASLKIEGRMKSAYYIASVVAGYRYLIDQYYQKQSISENDLKTAIKTITRAENRPLDTGFYANNPDESGHIYKRNAESVTHDFLGVVLAVEEERFLVEVRNKFEANETIEIFGPNNHVIEYEFKEATLANNDEVVTVCNVPMQKVWLAGNLDIEAKYFLRKKLA